MLVLYRISKLNDHFRFNDFDLKPRPSLHHIYNLELVRSLIGIAQME